MRDIIITTQIKVKVIKIQVSLNSHIKYLTGHKVFELLGR